MACPIRTSSRLWEIPELTAINRLPSHPGLIPFPYAALARALVT